MELREDARDVLLDRSYCQHQLGGDAAVRPALGHQRQDLALAWGQLFECPFDPTASEELPDDLRIERGAAVGDAADCVDEGVDLHDPVFQQVADPAAPVGEQLGRVRMLDVLRDDEHCGLRRELAHRLRGSQALVAEARRQADVDNGDVGALAQDCANERVPVLHGIDDVEVVVAEEARQPVAEEREIFCDHDTHGITARTTVPPPTLLFTSSVPSSAPTRRSRPRSPFPDVSAPPLPSSATWTTRLPFARLTVMSTFAAFACLPAFASDSATTKYAAVSTASGGRWSRATSTRTTSGVRSASAAIAAASPRSVSTGGWIPRASPRRSSSASRALRRASPSSSRAASGSSESFCSARPMLIPSATSCACAPSCKSRSMRRRSAPCWSTAPARVVSSCSMRFACPE